MERYTEDSRNNMYRRFRSESQQRVDSLTGRDSKLMAEIKDDLGYRMGLYADGSELAYCFGAVNSGEKTPGSLFREYGGLIGARIPAQYQEDFYYIADKCNKFQYAKGFYRRSVRTGDYTVHMHSLLYLLRDTISLWAADKDGFAKLYRGKADGEITDFFFAKCANDSVLSYILAARVDRGDKELEDALYNCIMNEGGQISYSLIQAVVMSDSTRLHEALCKLLLAAKLQEGVRQAICESADRGTAEAFSAIFRTICENDLVRYSSVKRAIATWTGLGEDNTDAIDRITQKQVTLINECLGDRAKRMEYMHSDDAMAIYMALWAEGFYDTLSAADMAKDIIIEGSRHQRLCASVYLNALHWDALTDDIAREAILRNSDDIETVAAFFRFYVRRYGRTLYTISNADTDDSNREQRLSELRLNEEQARQHYALLWQLYDTLPKKEAVYKPFVFPWYSVSISRGDVAEKLCSIAYAMDDQTEIDRCCGIVQTLNAGRAHYLKIFASKPKTEAQYELLVACVADREAYTQRAASELADKVTFRPEDYITFESMMKYKSGDIRRAVISLLLKQDDQALLGSIERLLTAKGEEMHLGALELIVSLSRNKERAQCFADARGKVSLLAAPTVKEQIQIDQISGTDAKASDILEQEGYGLYSADCEPVIPHIEKGENLREFFADCFECCEGIVMALDQLIEDNKNREYTNLSGETVLLGNHFQLIKDNGGLSGLDRYPFAELWRSFYSEKIADERTLLLIQLISLINSEGTSSYTDIDVDEISELFFGHRGVGQIFDRCLHLKRKGNLLRVMCDDLVSHETRYSAAKALVYTLLEAAPKSLFYTYTYNYYPGKPTQKYCYGNLSSVSFIYDGLRLRTNDEQARESLKYMLALDKHVRLGAEQWEGERKDNGSEREIDSRNLKILDLSDYILAQTIGVIDRSYLYKAIFEHINTKSAINRISGLASKKLRSWDRARGKEYIGCEEYANKKLAENSDYMSNVREIYDELLAVILPVELKRGDSETDFSKYISAIAQITGAENFVNILAAMGKDTINRSDHYWSSDTTKRYCLSHLLGVSQPAADDTAEKVSALLKAAKISERRLVEAAMYAPEWITIIGEVLGWDGFVSGCYYFIGHMKPADRDERRNALIARFTPITPEELANGAIDITWFRECYDTLGEKRFSELYSAAKYISDGARHTRARKYADAIMGRFEIDAMEKEISEKRNKDTLMAYSLLPLKEDALRRYRFIQAFLKQSKTFGAQRKQSEGVACDMALRNLASNAGYSDTMRLTLAMETELTSELSVHFEWHEIGDIRARIEIDEAGRSRLAYEKNGKPLKSAPAALKKDPYLIKLKDTHKSLTDQYSRTRTMLEQSMEDSVEFSASEINSLLTNPVAGPIIASLAYICGDEVGMISDGVPENGKPVRIAHTFDLYNSGRWHELQNLLFERRIKQPFKQVFRELYLKTDDEREQHHSLRYAGNQIQPRRTAAALKTRRWVADYEEGLQKIFYKEDIVARIYALADWFSPADIEAPTLEWVAFVNRRTGELIKISDVPDIIFSEVMRDVDLAVSVAHAGGVDPEASHSTIELRRAVVEFNLPLFGIKNVEFTERHAVIKGSRAEYSVHLGSGVIHKNGGAQIAVLPVHSQHRGRLFLPFIDDDPKTAEIMSKIVLFAQDEKIKDPNILSQINK